MSHLEQVEAYLHGREQCSPGELEQLADFLLSAMLKNRNRTKCRREEYPVLSARQWQRRLRQEIPFTALPRGVRVALGLSVTDAEVQ
jgi:hypothetical protein